MTTGKNFETRFTVCKDPQPIFNAQSFVTFEAIGGTLYTVILLSRLVGLHASRS